MKHLIKKTLMTALTIAFVTPTFAKVGKPITPVVQNWDFHEDANQEPAFNLKIDGYIGALARRGEQHITPALLVIKSSAENDFKNVNEVQSFVNKKYLKSKGNLAQIQALNQKLDSLFIYENSLNGKKHTLFVYAFVKGKDIVLFTQDTTEEMAKKVLADTFPNVSKAKFINF